MEHAADSGAERTCMLPSLPPSRWGRAPGLRLSHAYGLAQQSQGDLLIVSSPGAGATVSMYFPALQASAEIAVAADETQERALVVDDQDDVREMAAALFSTLGYDVLTARDGIEALALLNGGRKIDVLFSDVVMPRMSGIELAQKARLLAPGMKIILASGYAAEAIDDGMANSD